MYRIRYNSDHWFCRYNQLDGVTIVNDKRLSKVFGEREYAAALEMAEKTGGLVVVNSTGKLLKPATILKEIRENMQLDEMLDKCMEESSECSKAFVTFLYGTTPTMTVEEWIKSLPLYRGLPVVWAAGAPSPAVKQACLARGFTGVWDAGTPYASVKQACLALGSLGIYSSIVRQCEMGEEPRYGLAFGLSGFNSKLSYAG